ncbi:MAG: hypothetical protein JNM36_18430 [Chitinophagales bacterium]|jgi:hypothetical protein|nr:hypothetical protein [Chitinophagales bacterium]HNI45913.1 hypothetical protein [Chitinophagales bacterium]
MNFYDLDTVFSFGKYKGDTLREVFERDPEYVDHCLASIDDFMVEDFVLEDLKEMNPLFTFSDDALNQIDEKWSRYEEDAYKEDEDFFVDGDDLDPYSSKGESFDDDFDDDNFDNFDNFDDYADDDYDNDYDDNW